jgi:hypothetical protein
MKPMMEHPRKNFATRSTHLFSGFLPLICFGGAVMNLPAAGVGDTSLQWQALPGNYDFLQDQQTGDPSSDIVGDNNNPGFFTTFNSNGLASNTDGTLGFRIRLDARGGQDKKPAFDRVVWVGTDADLNGSLDVFFGANFQGSNQEISIRDAGSGLNTSPNTTSVSNTPAFIYTPAALNYDYRMVNYLLDGGTLNDVTSGGTEGNDYYVSFMIPLQDMVTFLAGKGVNITDSSPLRYVLATSSQPNSLNQDLGAIQGSLTSTSTWVELGGFTPVISASGVLVPEPSQISLLAMVVPFLLRRRR